MRKVKAGFVGFGEVNTPCEIIERKYPDAERRLEEIGVELAYTERALDQGILLGKAEAYIRHQATCCFKTITPGEGGVLYAGAIFSIQVFTGFEVSRYVSTSVSSDFILSTEVLQQVMILS